MSCRKAGTVAGLGAMGVCTHVIYLRPYNPLKLHVWKYPAPQRWSAAQCPPVGLGVLQTTQIAWPLRVPGLGMLSLAQPSSKPAASSQSRNDRIGTCGDSALNPSGSIL